MGSGGKSGSQTIGFRYYMSLHMGLCRGPIDELVQIDAGDLRAWPLAESSEVGSTGLRTIATGPNNTGVAQSTTGENVTVAASLINTMRWSGDYLFDAGNLFGGDSKEGGISGMLTAMFGDAAQIVPGWIATLLGGRVPSFRGVTTLFFDGLLTSMNPYPKTWEFRVRRVWNGWDGGLWQPGLAAIWMNGNSIKAMNGAHIVYECLTNRDWGRGLSRALLDDAKITAVAQKLYDENFGLCLRYNRSSDLSVFIQDVIDHIGGTLYPDRTTGLLAMSLLRDDYVLSAIPLFDYNSGLLSLDDSETSSQEDLVNETVVKWVDPITKESDRQCRVSSPAGHQASGAVNSVTRTYAGAPTVGLALRLAQRDLKAGLNALKRYTVVLDRRAWKIVTGSVFRISAPDRNTYNLVLRAGKITESAEDGSITVEAIIDVFGMPSVSFVSNQDTEWVAPDKSAQIATVRLAREATYFDTVRSLDQANLALVDTTTGYIVTAVGKPSALSQAYSLATKADGETEYSSGSGTFAPYVITSGAISAYSTIIPFNTSSDIGLVAVGALVQLGNEICRLDDISVGADGAGTITIARGCVDTIPQSHANGTIAYLIASELGKDSRDYSVGETVEVKVLPYTSSSALSASLAPADYVTILARQARPYPPADLKVNGTPFADENAASGAIVLTWVHRNRVIQQDRLVAHSESGVTAEAGATCTVRVYNGDTSTLLRTASGITSGTYTYDAAMAASDGAGSQVWFEVESLRGGLTSFYRYRFGLDFTA